MNSYDPLFHSGWVEFNKAYWGLDAEVLEFGPKKGTSWELKTVKYTNKKGQLVIPPRNPHIPVEFSSSSNKPSSYNRRKRLAIQEMASYYAERKVKGGVNLSPVVNDVRPFQWCGMEASPRYTYHIDIHEYSSRMDSSVLNKARKAEKLGYSCCVTEDYTSVHECLMGPEQRKGFDHSVSVEGLKLLSELMGEKFVCFIAVDNCGRPAGSWVRIYEPNGLALAWSAGVKTSALKDGVNNLLGKYALDYFASKNCQVFDFVGANIPPVAEMKEAWGGDLVCYYTVRHQSIRNIARTAYLLAKQYLKK
ncbi:MAG: GNAT family N-acetyltransferase [Actinobacteria bacterium]|nr:GNAT family N-acetyltransferase [Actinomycetota bacterium]